jgi:Asp-tRNA(Asn)/Glu-tRNA(Gln) amidotransferase A subunit family amidase
MNTARLGSTDGAAPLSTTLDAVCALTSSAQDAILAHELPAQPQVIRSTAARETYRLAVAGSLMFEGLDTTIAHAWQRNLKTVRDAGARIEDLALS